jgi:hypothetical protein
MVTVIWEQGKLSPTCSVPSSSQANVTTERRKAGDTCTATLGKVQQCDSHRGTQSEHLTFQNPVPLASMLVSAWTQEEA